MQISNLHQAMDWPWIDYLQWVSVKQHRAFFCAWWFRLQLFENRKMHTSKCGCYFIMNAFSNCSLLYHCQSFTSLTKPEDKLYKRSACISGYFCLPWCPWSIYFKNIPTSCYQCKMIYIYLHHLYIHISILMTLKK